MVGQAMDGHPFRQDPLIAKANPVSGSTHPTIYPTGRQKLAFLNGRA